MSGSDQSVWGRVDEQGAVYVKTTDGERLVGEYPDVTPEEALAYFVRKYDDLAGQVTLLEQRSAAGAPAGDIAKGVARLTSAVETANAVGDLASLATRLEALQGKAAELTAAQSEAARAAVDAAIAERTGIVEAAEKLAARDLTKVQWKQFGGELDALFTKWQEHQTAGPRLPKAVGDDLWKRFRAARTTIETARKTYFAEYAATQKDVRGAKEALIAKAEALLGKGPEGIPAFRELQDQWKTAGRAGKKLDDALWERFKAAGDALYAAKSAVVEKENAEFTANLDEKLAVLTEAEGILRVTDRRQARELLQDAQRKWDRIGKVPREQIRAIEDRFKKIEAHVRKLDDEHWERTNPSRAERSEGFAGQLQDAIAKLERELDEAKSGGDKAKIAKAQEALDARKAWLAAVTHA